MKQIEMNEKTIPLQDNTMHNVPWPSYTEYPPENHYQTEENVYNEDGVYMSSFHKKILEMRIRQSNRKWIVKEVFIAVFVFLIFILFTCR